MYAGIHTDIYMYIYIYMCVCVCVNIYIYIYIYICIHTYMPSKLMFLQNASKLRSFICIYTYIHTCIQHMNVRHIHIHMSYKLMYFLAECFKSLKLQNTKDTVSSEECSVFMSVCVCVYIYIYTFTHIFLYVYKSNICVCACIIIMYTCMHTCMYAHYIHKIAIHVKYTYVNECIHAFMHVCMHTIFTKSQFMYIHVCIHECIHVGMHTTIT